MQDFEILYILTISCDTIGTEVAGKYADCSTNIEVTHDAESEQHYTNTRPETGKELYKQKQQFKLLYKQSNSNLNSSNTFMPKVNNNEIAYFLPGPN